MMMLDKDQEKMALKALLKSLMTADEEEGEEDAAGEYVEDRRESSVTPEEVEGELYDDKEGVTEDAEETLGAEEEESDEEETPVSLRDLVASFMEGEEDPFADKKGLPAMGGGSVEIEVKKEGAMPAKDLAKKVLGYKKKKRRGM
jgi:hypothetical protein